MVRTNQPNATETKNDASLPDCRTLYRSDAKLQKACDAFARLYAAVRSAGRNPEKLTNGLLHALVFEARNDAGAVGAESLNALARRGRVRKDLWNGDVRPFVESLLAFAAKGGTLAEGEFAARRAEKVDGESWLARCRAVHEALRAEWSWPDAATRCVFARRLAAGA